MSDLTIGSLCSGYGGLDLAAEAFFGAETKWFFEFEKAPSKILEAHWPGVTNYGDMTQVDWSTIPKVDIICGGTPCQDLSTAGKRKGMTEGTRSNLWVQMREAIAAIRPRYVVWENVRGALSGHASSEVESEPGLLGESYGPDRPALRAAGRVQGDLAELGYRVAGVAVQASDAGAPHGRFRVFFLAVADPGSGGREERGAAYDEGDRDASGHDARGRDAGDDADAAGARRDPGQDGGAGSGDARPGARGGEPQRARGERTSTDAEVGGRRRGAVGSARDGAESLGSDRASADADASARGGRADEPIGGSGGRASSTDDRTGSSPDAGGFGERSEPVEQGRESDARRRDPRLRSQDGGADGADGATPCGCIGSHDAEFCERATANGAVPARLWARGNRPAARAAARGLDRLDASADSTDLRRRERGAGGWAAGVAAASSDEPALPDASGSRASGEPESGIRAEGIDGAGVADERRPGPGGDEWAAGADDGEFAAAPDAGGSGLQGLARDHTASGEAEARAHGEGRDLASADAERGDAERRGERGDVAGEARSAREQGGESDEIRDALVGRGPVNWGPYAAAIGRWEAILGREAPAPTSPTGRDGAHRLSAEFVEWMMGLPIGWVTDPSIGIKRNEQLKALGNGVVPQQALLALSIAWAQLVEFEAAA